MHFGLLINDRVTEFWVMLYTLPMPDDYTFWGGESSH